MIPEEEIAYWSSEFPTLEEDDIRAILEGVALDTEMESSSGYSDFLDGNITEEEDPVITMRDRAISKLNSKKDK